MNSKLRPLVAGELETPAVTNIINELVGIAQRTGHIKVANKTGGPLVYGTPVAFDGYDVTLAAITVVKADARPPRLCDAVLSETIQTDHAGIAYRAGVVGGLVADVVVGTKVYLSAVAGEFAFTAPDTAGDAVQLIGVVTVRHATAASILFFPGVAALGSLADAYIKPADGIPSTDLTLYCQQRLAAQATNVPQSTEETTPTVTEYNALLTALKGAGLMVADIPG
jgi:hypothetical protein